jgi:hypothetical protein
MASFKQTFDSNYFATILVHKVHKKNDYGKRISKLVISYSKQTLGPKFNDDLGQ